MAKLEALRLELDAARREAAFYREENDTLKSGMSKLLAEVHHNIILIMIVMIILIIIRIIILIISGFQHQ